MLANFLYHIKRPYHLVKTGLLKGLRAEFKYGFPAQKLHVIAITGTDGKTTTSTMLYHILKQAGKKVALLTTVAAYIGDEKIDTGFHVTSPDPESLHKFFKQLVDEEYEYVVLEVTSHGMYQYRTWGVMPLIAGITNVANEHLDYHINYQQYLEAKAELLTKSSFALVNDDDQSAFQLKKILRAEKTPFATYSLEDGIHHTIKKVIEKRFPEKYNQSNARLAFAISQKLQIPVKEYKKAIADFPGIPGRMEVIQTKPFKVIVDFAHTPQGLEAALTALRKQLKKQTKKGRLIAVYGAAGLRDFKKRPVMGKIGSELADLVVFTAEDPRTEDVWAIIRQMKEGLTKNHNKIVSIANRGEAIDFALKKLAKPGDIVGIFGKGHEQSMCYGTVEHPWDDRKAARETLAALKPKKKTTKTKKK
jgi:UDP-N-acetylmuramoyl-L-alanyl-D-glutamate--2,6-diaminopimelate ligase